MDWNMVLDKLIPVNAPSAARPLPRKRAQLTTFEHRSHFHTVKGDDVDGAFVPVFFTTYTFLYSFITSYYRLYPTPLPVFWHSLF